jgi:hypothetical protein
MEGFYELSNPFVTLMKKKRRYDWFEACEESFQELKWRLIYCTYPHYSFRVRGFMVYNDVP